LYLKNWDWPQLKQLKHFRFEYTRGAGSSLPLIFFLLAGCSLTTEPEIDSFATALANYATPTAAAVTEPPPAPTVQPDPYQPSGKIIYVCQISHQIWHNDLCMVNADGSGYQRITENEAANQFFPSFAPDGNSIVFSSNQEGSHDIYERSLDGTEIRLTFSGENYAPAISPDGSWIVYTHSYGENLGQSQLWLMGRLGENDLPLTSLSGGAWDPEWSPDGKQILFASMVSGSPQLFKVNADGSDPVQVTNLKGIRGRNDWSPDGKWLSTYIGTNWNREIVIFDTQGENLTVLTNGGNNLAPSFSPDGSWIVFTGYRDHPREDHGCEIYMIRVDGTSLRRLTDNDYCDWQPRWGR